MAAAATAAAAAAVAAVEVLVFHFLLSLIKAPYVLDAAAAAVAAVAAAAAAAALAVMVPSFLPFRSTISHHRSTKEGGASSRDFFPFFFFRFESCEITGWSGKRFWKN